MAVNLTSTATTNLPAGLEDGRTQPTATTESQSRHQTDDSERNSELEVPQPFSDSDHAHFTRGSDAATLRTFARRELVGSIEVDKSRVSVGETVGVVWDVRGVDGHLLNQMDFLGMFEVAEEDAPIEVDNLVDSKLRGFNSSQSGRVNWLIQSNHFHGRTSWSLSISMYLN